MAFRGLLFTKDHEHLDVFAVDLHETGPSGGDVHWRGAGDRREPGELRGPDPDRPGRSEDPYLSAVPFDDAVPGRRGLDAIPSVLVSADDVSASHGGTVGELDETAMGCRRVGLTGRRR